MTVDQNRSILAVDIGGTKILTALIRGDRVMHTAQIDTDSKGEPEHWLQQVCDLSKDFSDNYDGVAITVSGLIRAGRWCTLNAETLTIPENYPLVAMAESIFQCPVFAVNDAQAAAWAEFQFGSGQSRDMVFLTISTGIGGGLVLDGRLLRGVSGLAGHFGQWRDSRGERLESVIAGRWFARELALRKLPYRSARDAFAGAAEGDSRASDLIQESAERLARLCSNIKLAIDPEVIIIGGGIGLASGYIDLVNESLKNLPVQGSSPPVLEIAQLGANAGVIGVADLWIQVHGQS